jgi:hypothetical protein
VPYLLRIAAELLFDPGDLGLDGVVPRHAQGSDHRLGLLPQTLPEQPGHMKSPGRGNRLELQTGGETALDSWASIFTPRLRPRGCGIAAAVWEARGSASRDNHHGIGQLICKADQEWGECDVSPAGGLGDEGHEEELEHGGDDDEELDVLPAVRHLLHQPEAQHVREQDPQRDLHTTRTVPSGHIPTLSKSFSLKVPRPVVTKAHRGIDNRRPSNLTMS